jgi:hypothetical protein
VRLADVSLPTPEAELQLRFDTFVFSSVELFYRSTGSDEKGALFTRCCEATHDVSGGAAPGSSAFITNTFNVTVPTLSRPLFEVYRIDGTQRAAPNAVYTFFVDDFTFATTYAGDGAWGPINIAKLDTTVGRMRLVPFV